MTTSTNMPNTCGDGEQPAKVVQLSPSVWVAKGVRFEIKKDGIHVCRPGHSEAVLSFEDALARAEGQLTFL